MSFGEGEVVLSGCMTPLSLSTPCTRFCWLLAKKAPCQLPVISKEGHIVEEGGR